MNKVELRGTGITINTQLLDPEEALRRAAEAVLSVWPSGVVEVNENPNGVDVYVYRSVEARIAWDAQGWAQDRARDMVHLMAYEPARVLLVVEDLKDDLGKIVGQVQGAI